MHHSVVAQKELDIIISVIVPVYNEAATIREVLRRVARVPIPKEIIVVDDASTDGTAEILREIQDLSDHFPGDHPPIPCNLRVFFHQSNRGKGAAIRTALSAVTGEIVLIQDADLEYDPAEYTRLIRPIVEDKADVVYGSRFLGYPRESFMNDHILPIAVGISNRKTAAQRARTTRPTIRVYSMTPWPSSSNINLFRWSNFHPFPLLPTSSQLRDFSFRIHKSKLLRNGSVEAEFVPNT